MTWIAWQKMRKGLLQALVICESCTCCMQMIYTLTSNVPDQLQPMLDRLNVYAQRKGLVINAAKSQIVHFNLRGENVPVFTLGGARLLCADPFRYLGMLFTKQHNFQATAEHMCAPFLAGCRWIRQFASEYHLMDRPHTMLWLTKAYALPGSMYASQIWGTRFMKEGVEMECPLQTLHLRLLKRILGVKRTTPNWSVLRECGHGPLQFYWFRAAVRFYNALLRSNSTTLRKVLQTDVEMSSLYRKCWTSEFLAACMGLGRYNTFTHCVRSGQPIVMRELVVYLRKRLRGVWNADALAEHGEQPNKLAKHHHWTALPLKPLSVHGAPFSVPRYLHLELGKHKLRNIARFRLHAHTLKIETSLWQEHTSECDKRDQGGLQEDKHAVFLCSYYSRTRVDNSNVEGYNIGILHLAKEYSQLHRIATNLAAW
eukprot:1161588-Pelagomonas_calceolata.AAC.3